MTAAARGAQAVAPDAAADRSAEIPDVGRPRAARAHVRTPDTDPTPKARTPDVEDLRREEIGHALGEAIAAVGWSHKQAADRIHVDDAELGKWVSGHRRLQLDKLLYVPTLGAALLIALARRVVDLEVLTETRLRHVRPGGPR